VTIRSALKSPAPALLRFVKNHRVLWVPAGWTSRLVAGAQRSSPLARVLGRLRDRIRGEMKTEDVLTVLNALEAQHIAFSLAGGWGVDALLGRQTRTHDDLDVVIDDYDVEVGKAIGVLATLGFEHAETHERRTTWMPKRAVLDDGAGHRVELVSLNWPFLAREFGPPGADAASRHEFRHHVFSSGEVGGRRFPCISAEVQLLFHTAFELAPAHQDDVALLQAELGASLPEPERTGGEQGAHTPASRSGARDLGTGPRHGALGEFRSRESALLIPVTAADGAVRRLRRKLDPSFALGIPSHITILYPFLAPASVSDSHTTRLAKLFGRCEPFDFALSDLGWFDDRVMYLTPSPRALFVYLTGRLAAEFPEHPPYGGEYDGVIPHLTVGEDARPASMRRAARRLQKKLPIRATATEVWLMAPDAAGHWDVLRKFPLGGDSR